MTGTDAGRAGEPRRRLFDRQREFVNEIQKVLDPQTRAAEFERLTGGRDRKGPDVASKPAWRSRPPAGELG